MFNLRIAQLALARHFRALSAAVAVAVAVLRAKAVRNEPYQGGGGGQKSGK